ncbi:Protein piccolo [Labeo rohita]|uniref:Protein piccolo n=1 Tax=Labeo rohita TaxID=84645 RepID=A0ABQ8LDD6_LABRO|nr:Protein piccolo [Labeo rohita]
MDPASHLFCLHQGNRCIEDYVVDFCGLCYLVEFNDVALKDIFRNRLNNPIRSGLPGGKIHWSLEQYIDFSFRLAGFTVGVADEKPCCPPVSAKPVDFSVTSAKPQPAHVTSAKPQPAHVTSAKPQPAHVTSAAPGPAHAMPAAPGPVHAMPACPESAPVMAALLQPAHKMAAIPEPVHKIAAIPESVHKMAAIPEPVHKMAAIPKPVYKMAAITKPVHKMAAPSEPHQVRIISPKSNQVMPDTGGSSQGYTFCVKSRYSCSP